MKEYILVLDEGTTGVKALIFKGDKLIEKSYERVSKKSPKKGHVEQNSNELLKKSVKVMRNVLKKTGISAGDIKAWGLTVQRETIIAWDKKTGKPLYPAIVWEDARTRAYCKKIEKTRGREIREKTGLRCIPYFSASKMNWLLNNIAEVKRAAKNETLAFGTVDSWLMWNLLEGNPQKTDETNASRTLLFNIKKKKWDESLMDIFGIPASSLPCVENSSGLFGRMKKEVVGETIPLMACVGDQEASMRAAGEKKGTTKITYGTGTFVMQTIGETYMLQEPFSTTLTPGRNGKSVYALEGKIEGSGKAVDTLLKKKKHLEPFLNILAKKVDTLIKKLPIQPKELIIDGGITQAKKLREIQEKISRIPVSEQTIYDGTSLGTAKIVEEEGSCS